MPPGEPVAIVYGHQANVTETEISPDGKMVYTVCWNGWLRAILLEVDELIELARFRVTRSLTTEECQKYLHVEECPQRP